MAAAASRWHLGRPRPRSLLGTVVLTGTLVVLAAGPASAHVHGAATGSRAGFPLLDSVGLYLLVVLAGILAAPALARTRPTGRLRQSFGAALASAYAVVLVLQSRQ